MIESTKDECFFDWKFHCRAKTEELKDAGFKRIENIIKCSIVYGDGKHYCLQEKLDADKDFTIKCHRCCVSTYTSSVQTERHKRQTDSSRSCSPAPRKVTRRSSTSGEGDRFTFKTHCVYCGWKCDLQKDAKHPSRWRPAYMFRARTIGGYLIVSIKR